MKKKFLYVFTEDAKRKMLAAGFKLLSEDASEGRYIFLNSDNLSFASLDISILQTDTLTF